MVDPFQAAEVRLWGNTVGAVAWLPEQEYAAFQYDADFLKKGLELSPVHMGVADSQQGEQVFSFPGLNKETFNGLPGLLADSLPDKFGNAVIDAWLARNGRDAASFNPVERLCYIGSRGMGALEFLPALNRSHEESVPLEVSELVSLAQEIMSHRDSLSTRLTSTADADQAAMADILRVGTSAGGARPKAIIAMDKAGHIRSGQTTAPEGFDYWLLKFDGVDDMELGKPQGFGRIEYAYYLMARDAGIEMMPSKLYEENGRAHFMTRRFDREQGKKLHMQSLCGLAHYDFNLAGGYAYEQAFEVMRKLRLSKPQAEQQYRRMLFNIIARNQDDHCKNIAFLMYPDGRWTLSPAFDVTYSHNPAGKWTNQHQMTVNGKRDHFTLADLQRVGEGISLSKPRRIIEEIVEVVAGWPCYAQQADMDTKRIKEIGNQHRLEVLKT